MFYVCRSCNKLGFNNFSILWKNCLFITAARYPREVRTKDKNDSKQHLYFLETFFSYHSINVLNNFVCNTNINTGYVWKKNLNEVQRQCYIRKLEQQNINLGIGWLSKLTWAHLNSRLHWSSSNGLTVIRKFLLSHNDKEVLWIYLQIAFPCLLQGPRIYVWCVRQVHQSTHVGANGVTMAFKYLKCFLK